MPQEVDLLPVPRQRESTFRPGQERRVDELVVLAEPDEDRGHHPCARRLRNGESLQRRAGSVPAQVGFERSRLVPEVLHQGCAIDHQSPPYHANA